MSQYSTEHTSNNEWTTALLGAWKTQTVICLTAENRPSSHVMLVISTVSLAFPLQIISIKLLFYENFQQKCITMFLNILRGTKTIMKCFFIDSMINNSLAKHWRNEMECVKSKLMTEMWKIFAYMSGLYGRLDGSWHVNPVNPFVLVALRLAFDRFAWICRLVVESYSFTIQNQVKFQTLLDFLISILHW